MRSCWRSGWRYGSRACRQRAAFGRALREQLLNRTALDAAWLSCLRDWMRIGMRALAGRVDGMAIHPTAMPAMPGNVDDVGDARQC
jgi:hypothetical protein